MKNKDKQRFYISLALTLLVLVGLYPFSKGETNFMFTVLFFLEIMGMVVSAILFIKWKLTDLIALIRYFFFQRW